MRAAAVLLLSAGVAAQSYPPAFPRPNAIRLFETDRIAVWNVVWPKGQPSPMHRHVFDQVGTYYATGGRRIITPDGAARESTTQLGSLSTTRKGTTHIEEGISAPPLRAVFIELKLETASGAPDLAGTTPPAFPREGANNLLDDERVAVWDYTWRPGVPRAVQQFGRDTVLVWLGPGTVRISPESGTATFVEAVAGRTRYIRRGTIESWQVMRGAPRAMIFELK
jgi:hypothetical protein